MPQKTAQLQMNLLQNGYSPLFYYNGPHISAVPVMHVSQQNREFVSKLSAALSNIL